jgi:hypothetical protein
MAAEYLDTLQSELAKHCDTGCNGLCAICEAGDAIERMDEIIAELLLALQNWQNYDLTLEARQNAAIRAIARAKALGANVDA